MDGPLFFEKKSLLNDNQIIFLIEQFKKKYSSTNTYLICESQTVEILRVRENCELKKLFTKTGEKRHLNGEVDLYIFVISFDAHWSLLIYHKPDQQFYAYDSLAPFHTRIASEIKQKLIRRNILKSDKKTIYPEWIPQQDETWECGYYVSIFMYILLEKGGDRPLSSKNIIFIRDYLVSFYDFLQSEYRRFNEEYKTKSFDNQFDFIIYKEILKVLSSKDWPDVLNQIATWGLKIATSEYTLNFVKKHKLDWAFD